MSVYEITRNRPVPLGAIGIFAIVSGAEALVRRLLDWVRRGATAAELRRLSDEQLADIGLSRADVYDFARGRSSQKRRSTSVRHSPIATTSAGR